MSEQFLNNYPFLSYIVLGNNIFYWFKALIIFIVALVLLKLFKTILISKLKNIAEKTKTEIDDVVIGAINAIHWPFYILVSIYIALQFIEISPVVMQWSFYIILVAVAFYGVKFLEKIIDYGAKIVVAKKEAREESAGIVRLISSALKVVLWIGAVVLIFSNMGYDLTSLIAGLGIGGIAIALALQNILGDLFSSLAIYFDKPFKVGDFVVLGDQMGTVKKIGLKTTRIQVPQGEELIVANSELTKAQVRNFGVMERRRGLIHLGVTYDTSHEKLKKIPEMLKTIIEKQDDTEADRIHFKTFGDSSLLYEIIYYVNSGDYATFMDIQQSINLAIIDKFEKEKIEIAFPTQTLYLKK
ncbi:MAG: mechanosensitive ion channel family protein [Patescibacteria group bacterium]